MTLHVVTGAPCSGKTSYIRVNKQDGDIVIDYDALAVAFGAESDHSANSRIKTVTRAARTAAINAAVMNKYECWVIHTSPNPQQVAWYLRHGAKFHELDPGKDECIRRAKKDNRPSFTVGAIESWYKKHAVNNQCTKRNVSTSREW